MKKLFIGFSHAMRNRKKKMYWFIHTLLF